MRKIKKWRYYCDFCKKGGCSGGHIAKHERNCCSNPNRTCRMCLLISGETPDATPQMGSDKLVEAMERGGLDELRLVAGGCPCCILAGIIQWRAKRGFIRGSEEGFVEFNFKAERDATLKTANQFPSGAS